MCAHPEAAIAERRVEMTDLLVERAGRAKALRSTKWSKQERETWSCGRAVLSVIGAT